jgi:K+-sensing histidine kinase KdpD
VVVGWVEPHDRLQTSRQLDGLEAIPPRTVAYRSAVFADFDASAAIASGAKVVLADELAHRLAVTSAAAPPVVPAGIPARDGVRRSSAVPLS